jgi:(3,5-dihydroxyphenyl)acetyl-CoA 1,2-dioxygenase
MAIACVDAPVLERAGLPAADIAAWIDSVPRASATFAAAANGVSRFLVGGQALRARLPEPGARTVAERAAGAAITAAMDRERDNFLRSHAARLYDALTADRSAFLRVEDLLGAASARVPGLVPTTAELEAERARPLPAKEGIELAQGLLVGHVLADPRAGRHLIDAMLRPLPAALERLEELRASGNVDLGPVRVTRRGRAGLLELSNPRHLNAEDDTTLGPTECAVDLILLDPGIEVGVFRGGVVDHQKYQGVRVFGSGINLTRLYRGRIDYLFYLIRDLGYVNKIYRGITLPAGAADQQPQAGALRLPQAGALRQPQAGALRPPAADIAGAAGAASHGEVRSPVAGHGATEKLWIAAVERLAVGGACQLLHVVDHVVATRGSRLFLPARNEGIIPGASNLRLPRFVGDRAARQAILSGRQWIAGEPDADQLCDEVVAPEDLDSAVEARVARLTSSGLINAAANRCALRAGQEPVDLFREYMAMFAVEQARCHLSPALVRNLEVHWKARERQP